MNKLEKNILARDKSLFFDDVDHYKEKIGADIERSSFLVIGGAGSIGQSLVKEIYKRFPKRLHIIDISENNLVELVRDIRSSSNERSIDFKTYVMSLGSKEFIKFINETDYDFIFNLSAMKHVRSEKDFYTMSRMIKINIFYLQRLLEQIKDKNTKLFSVSSDKAANPSSIMGASKLIMEKVMMSYSDTTPFSTARFANVLFSDGSLPFSFLNRFEKRQPLSCPLDIERYFISKQESGELCLLSGLLAKNNQIFFPNSKSLRLTNFLDIAKKFCNYHGYELKEFYTEKEAILAEIGSNSWPCYVFNSDTAGEKSFEEFYTVDENLDFKTFKTIGVITKERDIQNDFFEELLKLESMISSDKNYNDVIAQMYKLAPELNHIKSEKNLDQKM